MATYTKRNQRWRAQVRKKGINKSAEFDTKSEAQPWAERIEKEIEQSQYSPMEKITFAELIDIYIKKVTTKKAGAREESLRLTRIAKTPLGTIQLNQLTKKHFADWQEKRLTEVSVGSVLRERVSLSSILNKAIQWEYIKDNPLKSVEKPAEPSSRTRRYEQNEIDALIQVSGFSFDTPPTLKYHFAGASILFAIETAMRAGEICSLTWDNVNLSLRTAFLPKTKNGHPRTVPLSTQAIKILQHLATAKTEQSDLVFQLNVGSLGSIFQKFKQKAGLKEANLHFHDTRREALSRLSQKVEVLTLAKISGHRDIKILLNTYYAPNMAEIAKQLD